METSTFDIASAQRIWPISSPLPHGRCPIGNHCLYGKADAKGLKQPDHTPSFVSGRLYAIIFGGVVPPKAHVGNSFGIHALLTLRALLIRLDRRKNERGDKHPKQDRQDNQREREHHRGHSAHDPANRRVVFAAFAFKLRSAAETPITGRRLSVQNWTPNKSAVAVFFARSIMNIAPRGGSGVEGATASYPRVGRSRGQILGAVGILSGAWQAKQPPMTCGYGSLIHSVALDADRRMPLHWRKHVRGPRAHRWLPFQHRSLGVLVLSEL